MFASITVITAGVLMFGVTSGEIAMAVIGALASVINTCILAYVSHTGRIVKRDMKTLRGSDAQREEQIAELRQLAKLRQEHIAMLRDTADHLRATILLLRSHAEGDDG